MLMIGCVEANWKVINVRRTVDNVRKRANGCKRHNPFMDDLIGSLEGTDFINPTDLEWMSLNYRKVRAAKMSPSKRRMILLMF